VKENYPLSVSHPVKREMNDAIKKHRKDLVKKEKVLHDFDKKQEVAKEGDLALSRDDGLYDPNQGRNDMQNVKE